MLLLDYLPGTKATALHVLTNLILIATLCDMILQRKKLRYRIVNFQLNEQLKTK